MRNHSKKLNVERSLHKSIKSENSYNPLLSINYAQLFLEFSKNFSKENKNSNYDTGLNSVNNNNNNTIYLLKQ